LQPVGESNYFPGFFILLAEGSSLEASKKLLKKYYYIRYAHIYNSGKVAWFWQPIFSCNVSMK
jgi:hypothetical protein